MPKDGRKPDLARIKQSVSFAQLISRYNLQLKAQGGNAFRGRCPLPTHTNEKDSNSFTATLKDKGWVWDCFSSSCISNRGGRKGGNILEFVTLMEGDTSLFRIGTKLNDWFALNAWLLNGHGSPIPGGRSSEVPQVVQTPVASGAAGTSSTTTVVDDGERNEPLAFQLKHIDYTHPYLAERGICRKTAEHFGVGYFPGNSKLLKGRIVFPIWSVTGEGNPVAYAGRAIDGSEPKYVFPPGFKKSLELWNLHSVAERTDRVIVLEGFFSLLRFHQAGIQHVVSLMGNSASEEQVRRLSGFARVTLCLDPDEAGRAGSSAILPALSRLTHVRVIDCPRQPDELSPEQILHLVGA
jgi:DNA primase